MSVTVDPAALAVQNKKAPESNEAISQSNLFKPLRVGATQLAHRIVLSPLTRLRANKAHIPTDLQLEYYSQRASTPGTLLITEATFVSANGGGEINMPGVWSDAQIAGWKKITDAVHARKSSIFMQIWALGRGARPEFLAENNPVENPGGPYPYVAPSNIPLSTKVRPATDPAPRPLTHEEIHEYIAQFGQAAKNAIAAGFDGVEIHAAHGYLVDQFIQSNSNQRNDEWGGDAKRRSKFPLAIVDTVVKAIGPERTGIRLSPWSEYLDMHMSDGEIKETYSYLVRSIRDTYPTFSYIHVPEPRVSGIVDRTAVKGESNDFLKEIWLNEGGKEHNRVFISAGGFTAESAAREASSNDHIAVAFGRHFIANPDLVARIKKGIPFTPYNRDLFYAPETPAGYVDYKFADKEAEEHYRLASVADSE